MTDDEASFIVAGVEDRAEAPDVLAELGCVRPPHLGDAERSSHPINLCQVLAGQDVGGKQVSDSDLARHFMDCDLGSFDAETCRLEPIENPLGPKVLPLSPGMIRHPCDRNAPSNWR